MARDTETIDLSKLPDYAFGPGAMGWWGTVGFMAIEGMGFALAIGCYFFLWPFERHWPPHGYTPPLTWATVGLVVALLSEIPNVWSERAAKKLDKRGSQHALVWISIFGVALLVLRGFEFDAYDLRWNKNAYGSITWALLVMHMTHLVTDVYDSIVLGTMAYRKPMDGRKFSDVTDNALYWHFIVATWVLVYVLVYLVPLWT